MSLGFEIKTAAQYASEGKVPEVLFFVGCSGSFDERAQKITKAFAKILHHCKIDFCILGTEEGCTGDPAKRSGNEFLFQMLALNNIATMNNYGIKNIVTTCPHCFNTIKNEYPELGGNYNVVHHTQFLQTLINEGKLVVEGGAFKGKKITYHDSCYLGRSNGEYLAPRKVLETLDSELVELKRCKSNGLCCGAGGAQMFKEAEKGNKEINAERTDDIIESKAEIVAANCPYCMTMLTDGIKNSSQEGKIEVLDIAELVAKANDLI